MNEEDINDLFDKLKELSHDLNDSQRELLNAILALPHRLIESFEEKDTAEFHVEFDAAFTPLSLEEIGVILGHAGPAMIVRDPEKTSNVQGEVIVGSGTVFDPATPIVFEDRD